MELDDLQRTRHNAAIMAANAKVMYDAFLEAGFQSVTADALIAVYFKAIMDTASVAEANKLLTALQDQR